MPELAFEVRGAEPLRRSVFPGIALHVEAACPQPDRQIEAAILNCQVRVEAQRRRYAAAEQTLLRDLFGEPDRWGETLRPLVWTNLAATLPSFTGSVCVDLSLPCSPELNEVSSKYFHGVANGAVPLTLLFSGTIFYRTAERHLQAAPIPWNTEARFSLAPEVWKAALDLHHGNTVRLELRRDVHERLYNYKVREGLATFDDAVERIIDAVEGVTA